MVVTASDAKPMVRARVVRQIDANSCRVFTDGRSGEREGGVRTVNVDADAAGVGNSRRARDAVCAAADTM